MLGLLAFTTAIFVGPEVAAPLPKASAPVFSNVAASTPIGNDFLVAFVANQSVDVQRISGTTGKPARDRATTLGTYASQPVSVSIASNGKNAIVAWSLANYEVWVALVDADGNPLIVRRRTHNNAFHLAVASLGDRYLLVIQASDAGGVLLDATTFDQIGGEIFDYPRTAEVSAASNGDTALVTFIGDRIVPFLVSRDGAKPGPVFTGLATNLRSAWDGIDFAVAWNGSQHVVLAKIGADGSVVRAAADLAKTNRSVAAVAGSRVVLTDGTVLSDNASAPLPVNAVGSVLSVAANDSTNLAILATPQLAGALTNFVDPSTAVPVALTSSQSSPSISAGLTQFFAGWKEDDRDVVARFAGDALSSLVTLPLGEIGVAAVDDSATALTIDRTTMTTHAIAADGTLLESTRIGQAAFPAGTTLAALRRNGALFGALLMPKAEFIVFSEHAWISDVMLPANLFGGDLAAVGDHWVAGYYSTTGGAHFDEINFLGRTLATRATITPYLPPSMAFAADDGGNLLVALPYGSYVQLDLVDPHGNVRAAGTVNFATRARVAWSGSEFVVVTQGADVEVRLFDRNGNMTADPVTIPMPLLPHDFALAAGPAGIAIAYVRGDAGLGDGERLFVRQLRTYVAHGRPLR